MFRRWFGRQSKTLTRFDRLSAGTNISGIIAELSAKSDELARQTSDYFNKQARQETVSEADQLGSAKGLAVTLLLVQLDKLIKQVNQGDSEKGSQKELNHYLGVLQKMQDSLAVFLTDYFDSLNQSRSHYRQYVPSAASGVLAFSGGSKYISSKDMSFVHGILHSFLSNVDIEEFSQIVRYLPGTPLLIAALIKEIVQHSENLLANSRSEKAVSEPVSTSSIPESHTSHTALIEELKQRVHLHEDEVDSHGSASKRPGSVSS